MNLPEFNAAIKAHLSGWNPTLILKPNKPANDRGQREYIRMTTDGGSGFLTRRTGIISARGNYYRHPVFIRFRIHTEINTGTERMDDLIQSVSDRWLHPQISPDLLLDTITTTLVGEESPHYIHNVDIGGYRDERI